MLSVINVLIQALAQQFTKEQHGVVIAELNVDAHSDLAEQHGVDGDALVVSCNNRHVL